MHDLRDAARSLRSTPVVSLLAVLSLALGIGANTAIFSILDSLLLRTLPVKDPQRLVFLSNGSQERYVWTNPIWEEVKGRARLFDGAFAWSRARFNMAKSGQTELVDGVWASGGMFDVLGVPPMLGRTLSEADDRRGGGPDGPVAVISYRFWQRRFDGAADVIGRSLIVERVPFTIVGVMPPEFFGVDVGRTFDVAIPIGTEPLLRGKESVLDRRSSWWLSIVLRVKPTQTVHDGEAALRGVRAQIREATTPTHWLPEAQAGYLADGFSLVSAAHGGRGLRDRYREPLTIVMAVVVLVLLIACANIANLLTRPLAAALTQVESDLAITLAPLADQVDAALVQERLVAWLSGFFGALALLLAALGLYGLTSYAVNRRRREIGIRMALGAAPGTVITLVLRRVAVLVALGTIAGVVVSLWATRFVSTLLYGLQPGDPHTLMGAVLVLATIGAAAGWLPARRASRIDPTRVLRDG